MQVSNSTEQNAVYTVGDPGDKDDLDAGVTVSDDDLDEGLVVRFWLAVAPNANPVAVSDPLPGPNVRVTLTFDPETEEYSAPHKVLPPEPVVQGGSAER